MSAVIGIDAGRGATTQVAGLHVTTAGTVSLGDQTATLTNLNMLRLDAPVVTSTTNTRTITNPATLYVAGAPSGIANISFANGPYAVWVDAGTTRLDGLVDLSAIGAGSPNLKITATSDTPTVAWTGGGSAPTTAPAGYIEIDVGGSARYIPFWA